MSHYLSHTAYFSRKLVTIDPTYGSEVVSDHDKYSCPCLLFTKEGVSRILDSVEKIDGDYLANNFAYLLLDWVNPVQLGDRLDYVLDASGERVFESELYVESINVKSLASARKYKVAGLNLRDIVGA